jgi:hypothetical protein
MSLNADTIELLLSKGLTGDDILAVARSMEMKRDRTGAERQARYRANKAERDDVTRDVTRDSVTETLSPLVPPKVFPEPLSNNPPISPNPQPTTASAKFALPGDIPAEPFAAFVAMRKGIRKPMSEHAKHLAVLRLRKLRDEEGWPPGDVLNHCTLNSYQGLFPPSKDQKNGGNHQHLGKSGQAFAMQGNLSDDRPF